MKKILKYIFYFPTLPILLATALYIMSESIRYYGWFEYPDRGVIEHYAPPKVVLVSWSLVSWGTIVLNIINP